MTHRQRVLAALAHQETDRVPIAMVCSGVNAPADRDTAAWLRRERGIGLAEYLEPLIDVQAVGPRYVGPTLRPGEDFWGVIRAPVSYGPAAYEEICRHPLADARTPADLEKHRWPSTDWFDYDAIDEQIRAWNSRDEMCLYIAAGNPFEMGWYLRGFQRTLEDLVVNPQLVEALLARCTAFFVEHTRRQLEVARGRVDLAFTGDDIGGQQGMLFRLDLWRERILPHHRAINRAVHEFGARVMYHSDGSMMPAVADLIDGGMDVLQALQFDAAGMDPVRLKRDFGDRLCFEGGISVQHTLPFGTPDDVRREVRERIDVLGAGGGYILGPSHAIQAGTPPANIVALFDEAARGR